MIISPFLDSLKIVLFNVSLETKNLILFLLNLSKVKQAPEHDIDDPISFLKDIDEVMDDEGLFVLQLSYTPLMLKQLAFDNICHEHVCFSIFKYYESKCLATFECYQYDLNSIGMMLLCLQMQLK